MSKQDLPKGIRNNNPGNIELGDPWQGLVPAGEQTDPRFCQFVKPVDGIRAIARTLITYQDKRLASDGSKIDSILEVIERWAPPEDNNPTAAYANGIARLIDGVDAEDEVIDMQNYYHLRPIVEGIIRHENGKGPVANDNSWYADDVIREGLRRAGVVEPAKPSPVKGQAVPAAVASAGAAQLAEAIPLVTSAAQTVEGHISSGSIIRVVFGVAIVGLACYLAYQQYRKAKIGAA